jgi:DNA invertase Pin-like site-specific DNA recombinase
LNAGSRLANIRIVRLRRQVQCSGPDQQIPPPADDFTDSTDASRKMMRQIAGAFAEYEKTRLVAKLRVARERKRSATGKCEGRKSHTEINPALVLEAERLRRTPQRSSTLAP